MKKFDDLLSTIKPLRQIVEKTRKLSIFEVSNEFLNDSNDFIPKDTSDLERSSITHSKLDEGQLIWQTPYARRLFYNPDYNFSKDANPNARGLWAEHAKSINKNKYKDITNKQFDKAKKEVL